MSVYKDLSTGTLKTLLESHFLTEYEEYDILMELEARGDVELLREEYYH